MECSPELIDIQKIMNKLQDALQRWYAPVLERFQSLDPRGTQLISESQFSKLLLDIFGSEIPLSSTELCNLAETFRAPNGEIYYLQFCELLYQDIDTYPTYRNFKENPKVPVKKLNSSEETRIDMLLRKIAQVIHKRRFLLREHFDTCKTVAKNGKTLPANIVARALYILGITIAPDEWQLLLKRFAADHYNFDYTSFINGVENYVKRFAVKGGDPGLTDKVNIIRAELPKVKRPEVGKVRMSCIFPKNLHFLTVDYSSKRVRPLSEVMLRIQEHCYKNQLRVREYFKDFDYYHNGRLVKEQFLRGLDELRNSGSGRLILSDQEIEDIMKFYEHPRNTRSICWKTFEDDVNQVCIKFDLKSLRKCLKSNFGHTVFTIKDLHKHPNCKVVSPSEELQNLRHKGYGEFECDGNPAEKPTKEEHRKAMNKIAYRVAERRMQIRPFFWDLDKHNRGYVSRGKMRRAFSTIGIPLTRKEILALEYGFNSDLGFHYSDFLKDLEVLMQHLHDPEIKLTEMCEGNNDDVQENPDIIEILDEIKSKVIVRGLNASQFYQGFDTRHVKRLGIPDFCRGLDQLRLGLTPEKIDAILYHFRDPRSPDRIRIDDFTTAVESGVSLPRLEKEPWTIFTPHVPALPVPLLSLEERKMLQRTLEMLSQSEESNLEELFYDYDKKLHRGVITRTEFERALSTRNLLRLLNEEELRVLLKSFAAGDLSRDPLFNYRVFMDALRTAKGNKRMAKM